MNCPICNIDNLPSLAEKCNNCGTDLSQLAMVNHLETKYVDAIKERISAESDLQEAKNTHETALRQLKTRTNWLIAGALLLTLATFLCYNRKVKSLQQLSSTSTKGSNVSVAAAAKSAAAPSAGHSNKPIVHVVEPGDNFENLGTLYFKDAAMGNRIAADNNKKSTQILSPGDTIYIYY
jgi:hypothetical protein